MRAFAWTGQQSTEELPAGAPDLARALFKVGRNQSEKGAQRELLLALLSLLPPSLIFCGTNLSMHPLSADCRGNTDLGVSGRSSLARAWGLTPSHPGPDVGRSTPRKDGLRALPHT